jgi:hypothetical protein
MVFTIKATPETISDCPKSKPIECTTEDVMDQGSFFRRQNTEGLTLVGLFMEGTTLTCLEMYSDAKKRTLLWTGYQSWI